MDVYAKAVALGCVIDNHESDLYVFADNAAAQLIAAITREKAAGATFRAFDAADGSGVWFEFPFQFAPYWERKGVIA